MTRRARLFITALFLLPIGALVVYLFLTWSPGHPFHMRWDPAFAWDSISTEGEGEGNFFSVPVLVENVSSTPIHLLGLSHVPESAGTTPVYSASPHYHTEVPPEIIWWGEEIPAHSTVQVHTSVLVGSMGAARTKDSEVQYLYVSRTKAWLIKGSLWVSARLPASWREHVPLVNANAGAMTISPPKTSAPPATP
ncbi:hypothetical protein DES53_115103 [Roseimicrobium gellanilyticum]|uniref:Uncharacterized protein n=1 Tax=Roseimicrobium gellanilyticum TaxID=748857 RepID=A0A366H5P9_9BACT|nr:hypothetical protein [Roseimicrobium gellanilyticum]RBP36962.1 hypothetical protein DES53_115103 [Roseimicrobium gellanilyticum]